MHKIKIITCSLLILLLASIFLGCISMPEPDGKEIYSYITKEKNYNKWKVWPGKDQFSPGREPHGSFFATYVNDDAFSAIEGKKGSMPYGSMIVKENYNPERKLRMIAVMYKVKGYDAENNDWFWARYSPEGNIIVEGKVKECSGCHGQKKDNDYIWTEDIK